MPLASSFTSHSTIKQCCKMLRPNRIEGVAGIEVTSWLVSADDFSSRVARGANERVSAANE